MANIQSSTVFLKRGSLIGAAAIAVVAVGLLVGVRFGLMLAIGLGFGLVLEGLRFGFAGPWRSMIVNRDPAGILGQLLAIAVVAVFALPLFQFAQGEITGAQAPIGWAMIFGAFFFGVAMQVVLACGSGTLVNAGSGNLVSLIALPFFAFGSFLGSYHLFWWTELGSIPAINLTGMSGLGVTLAGLAWVAILMLWTAPRELRRLPRHTIVAAIALAGLALLNLIVAGQPWGVVYGLGLWAAKGANAVGVDLANSEYWAAPSSIERLKESILTDYTSLTNIGIILGAFLVSAWRKGALAKKLPNLPVRAWITVIVAGFVLGYCARLAFGCNVGAFFSGIATGSLHGWAWFAAAFGGAFLGVWLRPILGLEAQK